MLTILIVSSNRHKKLDLKSLVGIGSNEHVDDFIFVIAALISLSVTNLKDVIEGGSQAGKSQMVVESVTGILDLMVSIFPLKNTANS